MQEKNYSYFRVSKRKTGFTNFFISVLDIKTELVPVKIWTLNFSSLPTLTSIKTSVDSELLSIAQCYKEVANTYKCALNLVCFQLLMRKTVSKRSVGF